MIEETVKKQVDERVAVEMEKMTAEVKSLKDQIEVLEKQKPVSKYGMGTTRPSTAANSKLSLKNGNDNKTEKKASPNRGLNKNSSSGAIKSKPAVSKTNPQ